MNILQKISANAKRVFKGAKQKSVTFFSSDVAMGGFEDAYDMHNLRTFKESLYLFIGVSMVRETVSSIPLEMYRIINAQGDTEEILTDPFLDVLERPNYRQTQKEFWKLAVSYYLLAGETFWYLGRDIPGGDIKEMVNLRPDNVRIIMSYDNITILYDEFIQTNGQIIRMAIEDVLHIKNIDPINPLRGVGVVRPATQRIITEKVASKHQANTFRNQGRPDIAIFTSADLSDEDADDARRKWSKIYGKDNGSQAGFFGDNVKSMQVLNTNPKEMDFINSQNFLRDDILSALHVPKAMVTSDDVNLANSRTARINYIKEACLPILDTFIDIINNKLLNTAGEDKFLIYDNPVIEDRDMILKEAQVMKDSGIITQNEARDLMGYPAVDGGDEFSTQTSPFTLSFKMKFIKSRAKRQLAKRSVLIKKFNAIDAMTKLIEVEKSIKRERNSVFNTTELKEKYIKAFNHNIDNKSQNFKDTIDVYNNDLVKRIESHIEKFGLSPNNIFDATTEIKEAKKLFVPLMQNMFKKIGQETLDSVANGFKTKASEQFFTPDQVMQALEHRSEFFILSMLDTDFNQLKILITQGLTDGKGVDEIGRDIRGYFDNMSVARAKTIARTETGRLVSQATNEAYKQSAFVTGKEWMTANDDKVRPEHQSNSGVIVDTNGVFPSGEHFPGELTINCRCALAPAV